ncbi:YfbR-like 5'-deoxynucleotidase [Paenibacillus protaetiae]|uniref:HD domain-containing protein n=1 Tax=Paenibacillus protaetiae TaxID=2509456 RepID=A0A4P6ETR5_9BACL|nr:YfbR-like 5'-deoxynucleotidase [Paenibacillus protaetiae]QAY66590.1 HD domain-containing protein [Paenibacillus protaetiae]
MKNGKFTNTIIRMQFVPRWSEHAPRFEDNAASHSFRCAAIAILAGLAEEKLFGRPVDKLKLLTRSLWADLSHTMTGSIKHVTKKEIHVTEHIRALEHELSKEIVSCLSKSLRAFAYDAIVNAQDDTDTGRLVEAIDTFDAFLFCHREASYGSNPFFRSKVQELRDKIAGYEQPSIGWLLAEFEKGEGVRDFLGYIMNLDTVQRWNGSYNLVPDNDATHSFRVASLALFNGLLERERFGLAHIDLYRLVSKSVLHDLPEIVSGDVVSHFKHRNPVMKHAFEQYERETAEAMIAKLPEPFGEALADMMANPKSADYEGEMLDIADKLDALIKAGLEMRNNPHYAETYYDQLTTIQHRFENPCVIFFLAYILHDLTYSNFNK